MEEFAHPLTLRFHDPALEQAYQAYRLGAFFRALDTRYLVFHTLTAAGFFLLQPLLFPSIAFHWANVVYPVLCLANCLIIHALPWPVYVRQRHSIQLLFRVLVDWNAVRGLPSWSPPVAVRSLGSFATHLVLTSGVGCLNWSSMGWPLLLQHHLPYSLLAASAFSHLLSSHVCSVVHRTAMGRELMAGLWSVLRAAAGVSGRLRALLLVSPGPLPAASASCPPLASWSASTADPPPHLSPSGGGAAWDYAAAAAAAAITAGSSKTQFFSSSSSTAPPVPPSFLASLPEEAACWASVSLIQLLLGFVLPTALVCTQERASRGHFLARGYTLPPESSSTSGGGGSGGGDRDSTGGADSGVAGGGGGGENDSTGSADSGGDGDGGAGDDEAEVELVSRAGASAQALLRRRRQRQLRDAPEDVSVSPSPIRQRQHTGPAAPPVQGSGAQCNSSSSNNNNNNSSTGPAAPGLLLQQQQPSPQTLERLRVYRRRRGQAGGWDVCELLQRGLWLLLASLVVMLFWELHLVARLLLGPTGMLQHRQDGGEGVAGGGDCLVGG